MDEERYLRQRLNDIANQRIAMGAGAKKKSTAKKPKRVSKKPVKKSGSKSKKLQYTRGNVKQRKRVCGYGYEGGDCEGGDYEGGCMNCPLAQMGYGYEGGYGTSAGAKKGWKTRHAQMKKATKKKVVKKPKRMASKKIPCSPWILFVKEYAYSHEIPYKQALSEAAPHYRAAMKY